MDIGWIGTGKGPTTWATWNGYRKGKKERTTTEKARATKVQEKDMARTMKETGTERKDHKERGEERNVL